MDSTRLVGILLAQHWACGARVGDQRRSLLVVLPEESVGMPYLGMYGQLGAFLFWRHPPERLTLPYARVSSSRTLLTQRAASVEPAASALRIRMRRLMGTTGEVCIDLLVFACGKSRPFVFPADQRALVHYMSAMQWC